MTSNSSPDQPQHLAEATFSIDMVETLLKYFEHYSINGFVTVEITDRGLWLRNPIGGRQFLGATKMIKMRPII